MKVTAITGLVLLLSSVAIAVPQDENSMQAAPAKPINHHTIEKREDIADFKHLGVVDNHDFEKRFETAETFRQLVESIPALVKRKSKGKGSSSSSNKNNTSNAAASIVVSNAAIIAALGAAIIV